MCERLRKTARVADDDSSPCIACSNKPAKKSKLAANRKLLKLVSAPRLFFRAVS